MNKLVMLVAIVAMVLMVTIPALAQISQNVGNQASQQMGGDLQSGDVSANFSVESTGNNSNQCATPLQFGNTGQPQDNLGILQYASKLGDVRGDGSSLGFLQFGSQVGNVDIGGGTPMSFEPALQGGCQQAAQQSSAANG